LAKNATFLGQFAALAAAAFWHSCCIKKTITMSSSWPIVFGIFAIVVAAFWYDASISSANAQPASPTATHATR